MRKNCFVESAILYPKTVKFENLKKIAKAQFSLALPHLYPRAESIKTLDTTLITIHVRAFPSTDHSNCVDVSKCYLACLFRAQEVPKHISVRGRLNEYLPTKLEDICT